MHVLLERKGIKTGKKTAMQPVVYIWKFQNCEKKIITHRNSWQIFLECQDRQSADGKVQPESVVGFLTQITRERKSEKT